MSIPIVGLSGGLGNQLFQIARGLALSDNVILDFDTSGIRSRKPQDILDFELPTHIQVSDFRNAKLLRRTYNQCLANSKPKNIFSLIVLFCCRFAFKVLFLIFNKKIVSVIRSQGVESHQSAILKRPYLIGYFQGCSWAEYINVFDILFQLSPKKISAELQSSIQKISSSKAIALHVRLGDYLQEKDFGNLTESYYQNALDKIDSEWIDRSIWVFSDDIELAKERLANIAKMAKSITWIETIDNSTAQTWFLLRHAADFVIANSTFSWWAAFLRINQKGVVCAPDPWFKGIDSPVNIIPKSWLKQKSFV
jgi:hypothetical protein